jgi:hypothetical protein
MTRSAPPPHKFILGAFDHDQRCQVLQALFQVDDLDALRAIIGNVATEDHDLEYNTYWLDDAQVAAVVASFEVAFDHRQLEAKEVTVAVFRRPSFSSPYLIHGGYELPLLLEGRKKLATIDHRYPPETFEGEDRFDHWVANGRLHREEVIDPPCEEYRGHRTVYYTLKGEEWRIPATKLIWEASGRAGGWNKYFERLEGMLFGYEDWQNDWWINTGFGDGMFHGAAQCCTVTRSGLAWIEAAGFRALPPIDKPALAIMRYDIDRESELHALMIDDPDSAALVRFNVPGLILRDLKADGPGGPWYVPADQIPELNKNLRTSVAVFARRDSIS